MPPCLTAHVIQGGAYSVVRFTSPIAATYVITGEFLAIDKNALGQTSDSVSLTSGAGSSLVVGPVESSQTPYTFTFTQTLSEGQSIEFAVDWESPAASLMTTALASMPQFPRRRNPTLWDFSPELGQVLLSQ